MTSEPNDQVGTVDRPPWAGLWVLEHHDLKDSDWEFSGDMPSVGAIAVIQEDFRVELFVYDSEDQMREAWDKFEQTIERRKPAPQDVVVWRFDTWMYGRQEVFPTWLASDFGTREHAVDSAKAWVLINTPNGEKVDLWVLEDDQYYLIDQEPQD